MVPSAISQTLSVSQSQQDKYLKYVAKRLYPDPKTQQKQQDCQELALHHSTVPSGQSAGKTPAAENTDMHPFPSCLTLLSQHSTSTEPSTISAVIVDGFSRKKPAHRTVLVELDLTAPFENVDDQQLFDCVNNTNILATILAGSSTLCRIDEPMFISGKKNLRAER